MGRHIKAIFFDIDGTLRDFETQMIPESTKKALKIAKEVGIRLFIATGRHKLEIEEENLLEGIAFDGYITLNGQYCYCEDKIIYDYPIGTEDVNATLDLLKKDEFPCMFMEADRMYINLINKNVVKSQEGIGTRIPPIEDVNRAAEHSIYQIIPYVGSEKEQQLKQHLLGCEFIRWHDGQAFDVVPAGGSKCRGIQKMVDYFGLQVEETAAIGDGTNDISMVAFAGFGIAMGNGKDEVKAAADYVTDSIEQDGLSKAVFYIIENNH